MQNDLSNLNDLNDLTDRTASVPRPAAGRRRLAALGVLAAGALVLGACSSGSSSSSATTSGSGKTTSTTSAGLTVTTVPKGTVVHVVVGDSKGLNGPMTLVPTPATVPAGNVTFVVKNTGTIDHEMVVLKTDTPYDKLPIADGGDPPAPVKTGADKVSEDANIGETGDPNLKPGTTRTFTIKDMKAGKYVLVCNIAKHYGMGMRAAFTVS